MGEGTQEFGTNPEEGNFAAWERELNEQQTQPKEKNVNIALKNLRNRPLESIAIRDGNTLIQSAIRDLQENQEPDNSEELQHLRELDSALLELGYDDKNEINYDTAKKLRSYFKGKKAPLDTQIENYGDTDPQLIANRDIYAAMLKEINKGLPTLEAALPEFPKYNFSEAISSGRIELPTNTPLTLEDIKKFYNAVSDDVSTTKTEEETNHPEWINQKNMLAMAEEQRTKKGLDIKSPLLITKKNDGTVEVKTYDADETHIDKTTQCIWDLPENFEYIQGIAEFDSLEIVAQAAVIGLEKLQTGSSTLSTAEYTGIVLFLSRLEKGVAKGEMDSKYNKTVRELGMTLKEKLENVELEKDSLQPALA